MTTLEPDRATLEAWMLAVTQFALEEWDAAAGAPAMGLVGTEGLEIAERVSTPISEEPQLGGIEEALARVKEASTASLGTMSGGYLAYVPGGGLPAAAMAELVASAVNRFTGISTAAPALARLEADVLAWLANEVGFPSDTARGLLTSGGSLANFSAILAARHAAFGDSGDFRSGRVYTSTEAHHSVERAVRLAGIPGRNVRQIPVDSSYRMNASALREAIAADEDARPFLVVAAAGTTNTGAVDPLEEIAAICRQNDCWFHVDGAYGGTFVLCPEGRERLVGLHHADSVTLDPHKGLFLPYGTGCLLVRDGRALAAAHRGDADYLQDFEGLDRKAEAPSPTDYGPELSRPFRGLRLWLPLMLHGAAAFRVALSEKLTLAMDAWNGLAALDLERIGPPQLSAFGFRLVRAPGEGLAHWNERNAQFMGRINARRRVHLSSTALPVVDGMAFTLRVCVLSFRSHHVQVQALLDDVGEVLAEFTANP